MADVNCYGSVISTRGHVVPLHNVAQTEGYQEQVQTDADFVGSKQVFGTFAAQQFGTFFAGKAGLQVEHDFTYAVILSAGRIKAALPGGGGNTTNGGNNSLPAPIPYPVAIVSGDTLEVMANAAATRQASVSVACTNGEYHTFIVTPAGSGEHEFVSILDGQGIGLTLVGRVISHWFATAGANDAELESPVYLVDGSGVPVGSVGFNASGGNCAMLYQETRTPIALNSRLVFRTDA